MKRTLKGIAAASIVLGMMAPAAFASTPSITWGKKNIQFQKYTATGVYGYAENGTTYMPIWYVLQALKNSGYDYTYDGKVLNIKTPSGVTPNTSGIDLGFGNLTIQINGQDVKKVNTEAYKDPAGGKHAATTTYIPIYYIQQILDAVNFHNTWDGTNWQGQQLSSVTASAANSSVSVGQGDQVSIVLKDSDGNTITPNNVSYKVTDANGNETDGAAITSHGVFTANQPGTYIVTVNADGIVGTTKIVVHGAPAAIKLSAAQPSIVADGASTDTVTVTIVDANGNPVSNFNGSVTVTGTNNGAITDGANNNAPAVKLQNGGYVEGGTVSGSNSNIMTFAVKNGQATITLAAGTAAPDSTDTLTVTGVDANGNPLTQGQLTVNYVAPVATALKLVPTSKTLASNNSGSLDAVTVQAVDQAGVPMASGTYTANVTLTGNATFTDGTKGPETVTWSQGAGVTGTTVYVEGIQGQTGTISLSATGSVVGSGATLYPATATINEVLVGSPAALSLSIDKSSVDATTLANATDSNPGATVTVTVTDSNGNPTNYSGPIPVAIKQNGASVTTLGLATSTAGMPDVSTGSVTASNGTATIKLAGTNTLKAGTYQIVVGGGTSTFPAQTINLTVTPGAPAKLVFKNTSPIDLVLGSGAKATVTAQVQDAEGNNVTTSTPVSFYVSSGSATINGYTTSQNIPVTVYSDADGVASVTVDASGNTSPGTVTVSAYEGNNTAGTQTLTLNLVHYTAQSFKATAPSGNIAAGSTVSDGSNAISFKLLDPYGSAVAGDVVQITVPTGLFTTTPTADDGSGNQVTLTAVDGSTTTFTATVPSSGQINLLGTTKKVGNYTISIKDLSTPSPVSASVTVSVAPGAFSGFDLFDAQGTNVTVDSTGDTIAAGASQEFWLKPVDNEGNVVTSDASYVVTLPNLDSGKIEWRLSPNGADVSKVTVPVGSAGVAVYAVNSDSQSFTLNSSTPNLGELKDTAVAPVASASQWTVTVNGNTVTSGGSVTGAAGSVQTVRVKVVDQNGNPVANQHVTFGLTTTNGGGSGQPYGTINSTSAVTDSNGYATVTYTYPASLTGNPSDYDTLTITVGSSSVTSQPAQFTLKFEQ